MPSDTIQVSGRLPASPEQVFDAFLDGEEHGAMTGAAATCSGLEPGAAFTAWDGYITGTLVAATRPHRIEQLWRTQSFPADAPDSLLRIQLTPDNGGTRVTFDHSNIPTGQGADYEQGWVDYYLDPMATHFSR